MEYRDLIAFAKQTTHVGALSDSNAVGFATNASCGDSCAMSVRITNETIEEIRYDAKGCVISRAAAAVIAEHLIGPMGRIGSINGNDVRTLLGAHISPLRERCLTTALVALQNAINSYEA